MDGARITRAFSTGTWSLELKPEYALAAEPLFPPPPLYGMPLDGQVAPGLGFEPRTDRLTADCSTAELPRIGEGRRYSRANPEAPSVFGGKRLWHLAGSTHPGVGGAAFLGKATLRDRFTTRALAGAAFWAVAVAWPIP